MLSKSVENVAGGLHTHVRFLNQDRWYKAEGRANDCLQKDKPSRRMVPGTAASANDNRQPQTRLSAHLPNIRQVTAS